MSRALTNRVLPRRTALAASLLAVFAVGACVVPIRSGMAIAVGIPPPLARMEVALVAPGPAYVWVPGYWDWRPRRHEYFWVAGTWVIAPRPGAVWVAPQYERRGGGFVYFHGYWRY